MKSSFLATAIAALVLTAGVAKAEVLPDFQVQEGAITGISNIFTADKLTGPYTEKFTVTSVDGAGNGTFVSSAYFVIQGFSANDGTTAVSPTQLGGFGGYRLYGIFTANGTISGIGGSNVTFTGTNGSFSLFSDKDYDTSLGFTGLNATATDATPADDKLLASSGTVLSGSGSIHPGSGNKGDFAIVFGDMVLSAVGSQYFFDPSPFYVTARASGQLDTVDLTNGRTTDLTGSVDIHFNTVPEPGTIALVGLALLGVGAARKRLTKA